MFAPSVQRPSPKHVPMCQDVQQANIHFGTVVRHHEPTEQSLLNLKCQMHKASPLQKPLYPTAGDTCWHFNWGGGGKKFQCVYVNVNIM